MEMKAGDQSPGPTRYMAAAAIETEATTVKLELIRVTDSCCPDEC